MQRSDKKKLRSLAASAVSILTVFSMTAGVAAESFPADQIYDMTSEGTGTPVSTASENALYSDELTASDDGYAELPYAAEEAESAADVSALNGGVPLAELFAADTEPEIVNVERFEDGTEEMTDDKGNVFTLKDTEGGKVLTKVSVAPFVVSVTVPKGVVEIGEKAFSEVEATRKTVERVSLSEDVRVIGESAFYGCEKLVAVNMTDKVSEIGKNAFYNCSLFSSILIDVDKDGVITDDNRLQLPKSLTKINEGTFYGTNITNLFVHKNITDIGDSAFSNAKSLANITFETDEASGKSSLSYIGDSAFEYCTSLVNLTIPDSTSDIDIGSRAFYNCTSLKTADLTNRIMTIGGYAFSGCSSLVTANIPAYLKIIETELFSNCGKLKSIIIPNGVETINEGAFSKCASLKEIDMPESVTFLHRRVFEHCTGLVRVHISENVDNLYGSLFDGCLSLETVNVPKICTGIWGGTFRDCISLREIELPESLENLGMFDLEKLDSVDSASESFYGCVSLKKIVIPSKIKYINYNTFGGCTSLSSVEFRGDVTYIGRSAFYGDTALRNITFPPTLMKIDKSAFQKSGLSYVILPDTVNTVSECAFMDCESLMNVKISEGMTVIDKQVFKNCVSLTDISLPNNITGVNEEAFANTGISGVVVYGGLQSIGKRAFAENKNLIRVYIPQTVQAIQADAFKDCDDLNDLYFYGNTDEWNQLVKDIDIGFGTDLKIVEFDFDNWKKGKASSKPTVHINSSFGNEVIDISVAGDPKRTYIEGEELTDADLADAYLILKYQSAPSTTAKITANMISGFDTTLKGSESRASKFVTVTYDNRLTAGYIIEVIKEEPVDFVITKEPRKTVGTNESSFDFSGGMLKFIYKDGTESEEQDMAELAGQNKLKAVGFDTALIGEKKITFVLEQEVNNIEKEFTINVVKPKLLSAKVSALPDKTLYYVGEDLDLTGAKLKLSYDTGFEEETAVSGAMVSGFDSSEMGVKTLSVKYADLPEDTFEVEVIERVNSITWDVEPAKFDYFEGDEIDLGNAAINVKFEDGSSRTIPVTPGIVKGFDSSKAGTCSVYVKYGDKTIDFPDTVRINEVKPVSIEITKEPTKTSYYKGEQIDLSGGLMTVKYNNGKEEPNVPLDLARVYGGYSPNVLGPQKVKIDYNGAKTVLTVTVEMLFSDNVRVVRIDPRDGIADNGTPMDSLEAALNSIGKSEKYDVIIYVQSEEKPSVLNFPDNAKVTISTVGDGRINFTGSTIKAKNDVVFDCDMTVGKDVVLNAGTSVTISKNCNIRNIVGNGNTTVNFDNDAEIDRISKVKYIFIKNGKKLKVADNGKIEKLTMLGVGGSTSGGTSELILAPTASAEIDNTGTIKYKLLSQSASSIPSLTLTNVEDTKITIDVRNASDTESLKLPKGGAVIFKSTGSVDESKDSIVIVNKDEENRNLGAVKYDKEKVVRAEYKEAIKLTYTDRKTGQPMEDDFSTLSKLFEKITDSKTDYTINIYSDVEANKLVLPKSAKSITIDGHGKTLKLIATTSLKANYDLTLNNLTIDAVTAKNAPSKLTINEKDKKGTFNAEGLNVKASSFVIKGSKNTANFKNCGDFAVVQGFAAVNVRGGFGVTKTLKVTKLNLVTETDPDTGTVVYADLRVGDGAAVTVEKLEAPKEAKIGLTPPSRKFKTIIIKKGITASDITVYSLTGSAIASNTVIIEDKTKSVSGNLFKNDGVSSGGLSVSNGKVTT